jgi:hypothetical protein
MPVPDLARFLKEWKPTGEFFSPSPEGLGRELGALVGENPVPYSAAAMAFADLDPTYVRALLQGIRDAVRKGAAIDWGPVVELCTWVAHQPRELEQPQTSGDADGHWGWARKAVADLLVAGFKKGEGGIPSGSRGDVWNIINALTSDPDPTPDDEASHPEEDPFGRAINSTRGAAIEAAIEYALWVRRTNDSLPNAAELKVQGLDAFPEVREVLERALDTTKEPALAIRSMIGRYFPWLVLLDREWATAAAEKIFPTDEASAAFFAAAWGTYVTFCPLFNDVVPILSDRYLLATTRLPTWCTGTRHGKAAAEHLAEHNMLLYLRGHVEADNDLLKAFWRETAEDLRAHAVSFLGRVVEAQKEQLSTGLQRRLQDYWERRRDAGLADVASHEDELAAFGWWFISGKFDLDWSLDQLLVVLRAVRRVDPDHLTLDGLGKAAETRPLKAVQCFAEMVNPPHRPWLLFSREEADRILRAALDSGEVEAKATAEATINRLAALGYIEYRDLLRDSH